MADERFAAGAMRPKVEAACAFAFAFVDSSRCIAGIGLLERSLQILEGGQGTLILPTYAPAHGSVA
jgi:carbamate kinase